MKQKALFIGLGTMGYHMAGHLSKNTDIELSVFNRTTEKVKKWQSVVNEQRAKGMDKLDVFEKEFMDGMQGINSAFKNLFH